MLEQLKKHSYTPSGNLEELTGVAAWFRRFISPLGRRSTLGGALEHLGALPLTTQSSLALVRLHDETLLLGITPQSITLLAKGSHVAGTAAGETGAKLTPFQNEERPSRGSSSR